MPVVKRLLLSFIMFAASLSANALGKEAASAKPTVYNHVTKDSNPVEQQMVKRAYRTRFNRVDFSDTKSFARERIEAQGK